MRKRLTLLGACVAVIGLAALLPSLLPSRVPQLGYEVVAGWPQLPPHIRFGHVTGVAVDPNDDVYVFFSQSVAEGQEPGLAQVAVFDREGNFLRAWGEKHLRHAHGLRIDHERNVWLTDQGRHLVMKFSRQGDLLLQLGKPDEPGQGPDQFNRPTDVAIAPSGEFYVSDGYGNSRVVKFSREGKYLKEWGTKGAGPGELHVPHGICLDQAGRVLVADRQNLRIQRFTPEGDLVGQWGNLGQPFGLAPDGPDRLWVTDGANNWVTLLNGKGKPQGRFGSSGDGPGQFRMAHGICVDRHGAVYVTDALGDRVQKFVAK